MSKPAKLLSNRPATPLSFARSGIFSIDRREAGEADFVLDYQVPSDERYQLLYTGPRLDQSHALVWQAVVQKAMAQKKPVEGALDTTSAELLRAIGLEAYCTHNRRRLARWLKEIGQATVVVTSERYSYQGPLLHGICKDKATGHLQIVPNAQLAAFLDDEVLFNDLARKASLPGQLTMALHDLIASHRTVPATPIAELHRYFGGARQQLKHFRQEVKKAMAALTQGPNPLVAEWHIDDDDCLVVAKKAATRVKLLPPGTAGKKIRARAVAAEVNAKVAAARKKRTEVAL